MTKKRKPVVTTDVVVGKMLVTQFEHNEFRDAVAEKLAREREALRLYEPLKYQEEFHKCRAPQVVIQKGNRTGGSVANMVEVARAVTGQDPYNKYPKTDGRAIVLGYGEKHIGRVFHKLLFRPGAFDIIRDEETGKWRTFRPWAQDKGGDSHRDAEKKPAPPLIPKRFIKSIAWEKKSEKVFSLVTFVNGWELHAMNSSGDAGQAQGFDAHLYSIDEDLATTGWHEEATGRIAAVGGLLRWSALPHARNNDLMGVIDQAEREAGLPNPGAVVIRASILDNKYINQDSVQKAIESWKAKGDDVYRKRVMGEIVLDSVLMYPTYNRRIHSALKRENEEATEVQRILMARQGEPPDDWTKYLVVDPGHTVCAVLFAAVPPPEIGRQKVIYQEAYIRNSSAAMFGEALDLYAKDKVFEKFIIDMHGANLTSSGSGVRPLEDYTADLTKRNMKSEQTGGFFAAACDRLGVREEALRNLLAIERDGQPTLLIVNERCPNLCIEMERFRKKTIRVGGRDMPTDEGNRRANTHAVECLEYLAADGMEYLKPRRHSVKMEYVDYVLGQQAKRDKARQHMGALLGSNTIPLGPQGAAVL